MMRRYRSLKNKKSWRAERGALDAREKQERRDIETAKARAAGRCEVTLARFRCLRPDQETHHVIKRSQGGKFRGPDYLMRVCRTCHSLMDAATTSTTHLANGEKVRGQLKAVALGGGKFRCWMETAAKTPVFIDKHVKPEPDELQRITMRAVARSRARAMGCEATDLTGDAPTERSEASS